MPGMWFDAGMLYAIARDAYTRTTKAGGDDFDTRHQRDAVVAIVFSAAAVECLINELGVAATDWGQMNLNPPEPESIAAFGLALEEFERQHAQPTVKVAIAIFLLTGKKWDRSKGVYHDLRCLFELRNALMHLKPLDVISPQPGESFRPAKLLKQVEGKGILSPLEAHTAASWTMRIGTRAAARWACNTAAETSRVLRSAFPDSFFKSFFGMQSFDPLD